MALSLVVSGTILAVRVLTSDPVPRTEVTLLQEGGERVSFALPGANGGPPAAVWGLPVMAVGQRWGADLVRGGAGWVPRGLGEGLWPLDACPVWNLNGVHYDPDQIPLLFWFNEGGVPGVDFAEAEGGFQEALQAWTEPGCTTFQLQYGGLTSAWTEDDGMNVVAWETTSWDWGSEVAGMSMTRFDMSGAEPRPAGADILFNGVDYDWTLEPGDMGTTPYRLNYGSVVAHELGHVAGLDHEYDRVTSTMFYAYIGGDWMASLAGDDRRGVCEAYPSGLDDCAVDEDCADLGEGHVCADMDGIRVCDEVRDPPGASCGLDWFNCEQMCAFRDIRATDGYCAVACDTDGSCPEGFHCGRPLVLFPDPGTDVCVEGAVTETGDTGDSAGPTDSGADTGTPSGKGSCGCATGGSSPLATLLGILVLARRRRTRRTV